MEYRVRVRNTQPDSRGAWGAYVAALRSATGMSRAELARRLGVDPTTVWRWETSGSRPESAEVPEAIAALFKLDPDEVLAAAGLKGAAARPIEPTVDRDEELELILNSGLPQSAKVELIADLERERTQDRERRMDRMRRMIGLYGRRAG